MDIFYNFEKGTLMAYIVGHGTLNRTHKRPRT